MNCSDSIDTISEKFRVQPSFRDNLSFSASMISPDAMDAELGNLEEDSGYTDLPDSVSTPAIKHGKWGWWVLISPFIL